jgi:GAF domain-containing protein
MATQRPAFPAPMSFVQELLQEREVIPRAKATAREITELLSPNALVFYIRQADQQPWIPKVVRGEISLEGREVPAGVGTLEMAERARGPVVLSGDSLRREDYAHLHMKRELTSLAYLPIVQSEQLIGLIELIGYDRHFTVAELTPALALTPFAGLALASAISYEQERNSNLASISRLSQLYDLEHVFNSILQMDRLLPLISSKIRDIMEVQACNLWMVQGDELILLARAGEDPTLKVGVSQKSGEGIANEALDTNKSILITKADDVRLVKRNAPAGDKGVQSLLAVPIVSQGFHVGVLEIINRDNGMPFSEDDFYFMSTVMPTVANALHNASLLEAERKVAVLETLVEVSREITSSLNLERIIQIVVNGPQKIMAYDRAAVALNQRGKVQLKAISGKSEINNAEPTVKSLRAILEWASDVDTEIYVVQHGNSIEVEREETRLKFKEYFAQTGMRAFYCVPLLDEQGSMGVLSFESRNPDFLMETHFELIKVLASQTTVALRNASLYTEVPFIGVLEPLLQKKHEFLAMETRRRSALIGLAVAVVLFLAVFPLPMRVVGDATVTPETTAKIQASVEGVLKKIYVQEGDVVKAGTILADMEDWEFRTQLAATQAKHATLLAEMNRALAAKDGSEAGIKRFEVDYWSSEVTRASERLERTHLRTLQDGIVATPRVGEMAGRKLELGDEFATVVSTAKAQIDVAIDEQDLPLLENGSTTVVKLDGYPTRKFSGTVLRVSPISTTEGDRKVFYARVSVPNEEGLLRPGMQGRGKVSAGWRPAGYVLFRGAGMWAWSKLWSWFGW